MEKEAVHVQTEQTEAMIGDGILSGARDYDPVSPWPTGKDPVGFLGGQNNLLFIGAIAGFSNTWDWDVGRWLGLQSGDWRL